MCSFVTSSNKFLLTRNLAYWFLGTAYFVYVDKSVGGYRYSLFSYGGLLLLVNGFYHY